MTEATVARPQVPGVGLRLLSDERLARRAAGGDQAAFALIFERHHQGIYRYCRSMLGHEDASDALQSTMAAALRALPGDRREIALKPWLYRIAHNESISLIRRRRPSAELTEDLAADGSGLQEQTESRERLAALVGDLRELPERQSGALVMRELNGLGYTEIGAAFSISEAAAKQSVYNARVALGQFAEGRAMQCESARQAVSGRDGRTLRSLRLRAHLRHCEECAAFKLAFGERRAALSALAPPIAPAAAAALLGSILHGGGGAGGGGLLALLSGASGKLASGGAALKASATVGVVLVAGAGVATVEDFGAERGAGESGSGGAPVMVDGSRSAREQPRQRAEEPVRSTPRADRRDRATGLPSRDDDGPGDGNDETSDSPASPGSPDLSPNGDAPGPGRSGETNAFTPANGPPAAGGPASAPGRETARQHAPSGLPAPAQLFLGGDGEAVRPGGRDASALPAPGRAVPSELSTPGR
jgi:RNA polymerase sigma factor (sigma-70 family)